MKDLRRFLSCLLAVAVLLALGVTASAAGFTDVPADPDYAEAVQWASDNGYIYGYGDGRFGVNDNVTRAQLATIFHRAAGMPTASGTSRFSDAVAGAYYINALGWAENAGLIAGYPDGRFGVDDPVTRQQVAAILWRWAGSPAAAAEDHADEDSISAYAQTAVDWSRSNGIIAAHNDGRFAPNDSATRGEIVSALYNYMGKSSETPAPSGNGKVLVAYFSASGNTEAVANAIADTLDADLFEMIPESPYTSADLDWTDPSSRVNAEHNDPAKQDVKLADTSVDDWADYDTVFIGYPIWWGNAAWPVNDFVKNNDFTGKTVIPFCTSTSSGLGQSGELLKEMAGTGNWQEGRRFTERASQSDIAAWASSLDLPKADTHYNVYIPESYDGSKPYALFFTLPGYEGLYFQGVASNIKAEPFGFEAQKYDEEMIVVAPQLNDWGETSADQTIALVEYFLKHYNIDPARVYANGYSGGGETMSIVMGKRPELFTAYLHRSSQWDGDYSVLAESRTPVYLAVGKNDEYYGSEPTQRAYDTLSGLYREQGLSEDEIDRLLVLDIKDRSYFTEKSVNNEHGGGGLFASDEKIMGWLFSQTKHTALSGIIPEELEYVPEGYQQPAQ